MEKPAFSVIGGRTVSDIVEGRYAEIVSIVESAYLLHADGRSINPPSYFLRFPDRPESRIIALPASLGGEFSLDGLKWISSFPGNIENGLPRASAVLILNDQSTGFPIACLEGSVISATRTAASAALAAARLHDGGDRPRRITYFGTGLIARYIHSFLHGTGWRFQSIGTFDRSPEFAAEFARTLEEHGEADEVILHHSPEAAIRDSDLIVFATTASVPHVTDISWFQHNPTVLHISLRDLAPEIILGSCNILDDIEHCLKAATSPHLAEQMSGSRGFIDATLAEVLRGDFQPPRDRPVIFSPFGLGVLDIAVGSHVYQVAEQTGRLERIRDFFPV
ncbi:2,3-diaminopropionate biosynthesis protein SbnB [Nocardia sp. 004]|uniref:2,3-diaminopropionate biosynthesis protein SbnB n=1 Tax=Nocardia sp. 004 TaxID=3385978 RepID=UPI0039A3AAC9